ncbi:hypothetical protein D2N39_14090 [Gemmobacter lutimaris]|uniref:Uncharacterized protein n=1 Tax=Gemmobacter lutimaris TaxID=2306023 RepID=A0A398BVX5_9RHOB|nr:hypothetical protein [Gemmobacter lutimaris]RID91366.1 hypothetical protein D2N39_14090 [Gemmobacter lutimaris]
MRFSILLFAAAFCASSAVADTVAVKRDYSFRAPDWKARDDACVSAFQKAIFPQYEGLRRVQLTRMGAFLDTSTAVVGTWPDVRFRSRYGDATGVLTCVLDRRGRKATDVGVAFSGAGLAGFMQHPLAAMTEASERLNQSYGTSVLP